MKKTNKIAIWLLMSQSKISSMLSIWGAIERINNVEEEKNRQSSLKYQFPLVFTGDWEFNWMLDLGDMVKLAEKSPAILSINFNEINSQSIKIVGIREFSNSEGERSHTFYSHKRR